MEEANDGTDKTFPRITRKTDEHEHERERGHHDKRIQAIQQTVGSRIAAPTRAKLEVTNANEPQTRPICFL
jgi:hypothetical protein